MEYDDQPAAAPPAICADALRALVCQLPDVVILHREGSILLVNQTCVDLLGYERQEEFIGADPLSFLHPDDRKGVVEQAGAMRATGKVTPTQTLRVLHKNGAVLRVEMAPVRYVELPGGRANLVVCRDRTLQRNLGELVMETDRIASLGSLAGSLAHELGSPLTYIMGNLAVIGEGLVELDGSADDGRKITDLRKAVADARQGAERIRGLLADLKVLSRPDLGDTTRVELRKVLETATNMAWPQIRPCARLVRDYGEACDVRGVESKLALALFHLLVNAAEAIERGAPGAHQVYVKLFTDSEGWACIEVSDSGTGIDEAVARQIWEPFVSTRNQRAGLGLPLVKGVIAAHGGEVHLHDVPDGGALARVRLPPIEAGALERSVQVVSAHAGPERFGQVLVVDDEAVIGALLRRALKGHDVYIVNDASDAVELAQQLEFDVIICDLIMPGMGGMELYKALSQCRPAMLERIVFVTAGAFSAVDRAFLDGIDNLVIDKPFDFSDIRFAVQTVLQTVQAE